MDMALLEQNVLILDQVRGFMSNDFTIMDMHGQPAGYIHTEGSGMSRFFMGNRQFTVTDVDGQPMLRLDDVMSWGRDRMNVMAPDGQLLAELVRRFSFLKRRVSLQLANGQTLELTGSSMFDHDFAISGESMGEVARVSRSYSGIGQALLGRERYVLEFMPAVEPWLRAAIIGAVIGLDLMREKDRRSSN